MTGKVVVVDFRRKPPARVRKERSLAAKELAAQLREIDDAIKGLQAMRIAVRAAYNKERGRLTARGV